MQVGPNRRTPKSVLQTSNSESLIGCRGNGGLAFAVSAVRTGRDMLVGLLLETAGEESMSSYKMSQFCRMNLAARQPSNLGLQPAASRQTISPSSSARSVLEVRPTLELMAVAGHELAVVLANVRQRAEAVEFHLVLPVGMIEWFAMRSRCMGVSEARIKSLDIRTDRG
jgi:hypothetical protein